MSVEQRILSSACSAHSVILRGVEASLREAAKQSKDPYKQDRPSRQGDLAGFQKIQEFQGSRKQISGCNQAYRGPSSPRMTGLTLGSYIATWSLGL
jgi:hypothetical protein